MAEEEEQQDAEAEVCVFTCAFSGTGVRSVGHARCFDVEGRGRGCTCDFAWGRLGGAWSGMLGGSCYVLPLLLRQDLFARVGVRACS